MPLLRKKTLEKVSPPELLRDDEEVFYCAVTNEIFRDYEDFSERMFLCNSMVWTCSMTGKSNLTYQEALESEENARKSLKEFPSELKIPILYLASKTKRTSFSDMVDDIFFYVKDRYFIGENVETSFTGSKWKDSHVLQVIAPSNEQIKKKLSNGESNNDRFKPPAALYKYEIEHLDAYDQDVSEIMIADCNQIRRKGRVFSREKCKLFLKQYLETDDRGVFVIKKSAVDNFNLSKITFDQIFDGPLPEFDASKRFEKAVNGKKTRQESLHKFLTKSKNVSANSNNAGLLERMKKREEEFKLMKQKKKEEAEVLKQKKKEESVLVAGILKDWYKPKEDLELIDQKKIPVAADVKCKIPDKYFGDVLLVIEFVHNFGKLLSAKDFFHNGLTLEIMERALTKSEVAGPYIDIVQMFLNAIFKCQDEEVAQYKSQYTAQSNIKQEDISDNMNLHEATQLATAALSWSTKYQGLPLGLLPMYSLTTSEILRLHLLSSGANINFAGTRWRYQQRGGYTSEDDPGLYLRLHEPHILKALAIHNVVELPLADKLKILTCLVNQLLTYAEFRDIIDERIDNLRQAKTDYKSMLVAEKKREQEYVTARSKLKKEKDNAKLETDLNKLALENDNKKAENEFNIRQLLMNAHQDVALLGEDRAYRQYLKLESIPGLFVNSEVEFPGICLNSITKQRPDLIDASRDVTVAHIKKTLKQDSSSDKENSPSKSPIKVNGSNNSLIELSKQECDDLMMCSADPTSCKVHGNKNKQRWSFYYNSEQLNALIDSLNVRGYRESELQQNLKNNKELLEKILEKTPIDMLNPEIAEKSENINKNSARRSQKSKFEHANLGYPSELTTEEILHSALIENILEMEEKVFAGGLGSLLVPDREKWRNIVQNRRYDELDKTIMRRRENGADLTSDENSNQEKYEDPGQYLGSTPDLDSDDSTCDFNEILLSQSDDTQECIKSLAIALAQIARGVKRSYLKRPLGKILAAKKSSKKDGMLDQWQTSLLASTSFSQVFLHYGTLDSCIMWSRSALLAKCRICKRQNNSENMLLCDNCNLGHHLYCLKPKLKSVPEGDWFCNKCLEEKASEEEKNAEIVEATPVKKRRIFRDEEVDDEEEESDNELKSNNSDNSGSVEEEDGGDEEEEEVNTNGIKVELCKTCGSGGEVIYCEKCSENYHIECVEPPLRRAPRGIWICHNCKKSDERRVIYDSNEEVISRRTTRRDDCRSDLPLHNAALHEVLTEIMKDENAWPFLRPVQKNDVPDYYDVITKPMDFGTIKYKLNMGEYTEDAQFMADAVLVFQNCNTYNHTEDDVYKCGVRLLKHFQKKCRELGLKLPPEMDYDDEHEVARPRKKLRTK